MDKGNVVPMHHDHALACIQRLARRIADGERPGVLSTAEKIAVGFLYSRVDWMPEEYRTDLLGAFDRLAEDWMRALREAHRLEWHDLYAPPQQKETPR